MFESIMLICLYGKVLTKKSFARQFNANTLKFLKILLQIRKLLLLDCSASFVNSSKLA